MKPQIPRTLVPVLLAATIPATAIFAKHRNNRHSKSRSGLLACPPMHVHGCKTVG